MKNEIPQVEFKKPESIEFDFEIYPLQQLFSGYLNGEITDHSIESPHRVSFYLIIFITNGQGAHYIDFQPYSYKKGSILFLTKGQIHAWEVNEKNEGFVILFTEEFIQKSFGFSQILQYYRLFNYQLYTPVVQLEKEQYHEFSDIIQKLEQEFLAPNDFAKEKIISSLLNYLLMKAERFTRQERLPVNKEDHQRLFIDFKNLLFKNYQNNRNASFYADSLHISYKHLNTVCKSTINQTAKEFINTFLILELKRRLISADISIKELTYQMGFDEPTNLVKFFKKYVGQTPAQFRKFYQK